MGNREKRAAGSKAKVVPGKARRERAAAFRDVDARVDAAALIKRLEAERAGAEKLDRCITGRIPI